MMKLLLLILLTSLPHASGTRPAAKQLLDDLLDDYGPIIRPVRNHDTKLRIIIDFEMTSTFMTSYNQHESADLVKVFSDGKANMISSDMLKMICSADVTSFPYDSQTCGLIMKVSGYDALRELEFVKGDGSSHDVKVENSEWRVTSIQSHLESGDLHVIIQLKRRETFPVITLVIPVYILGALNPWMFLLPPESGERVSFATTTVLSFTVYISIITDKIPVVSDPIADVVSDVFSMLVNSVLILMCTIVSLRLHVNVNRAYVPIHVQRFVYVMSFRCCRGRGNIRAIEIDDAGGVTSSKGVTWKNVCNTYDTWMALVFYMWLVVQIVLFFG